MLLCLSRFLYFVIPVPAFAGINSGGNLGLNKNWIPSEACLLHNTRNDRASWESFIFHAVHKQCHQPVQFLC